MLQSKPVWAGFECLSTVEGDKLRDAHWSGGHSVGDECGEKQTERCSLAFALLLWVIPLRRVLS